MSLSADGVLAQSFDAPSGSLLVPAGVDDRAALAEGIRLLDLDEGGWNSLQGVLAVQTGWADTGLRALDPGLLFEGVAYPLPGRRILDWAPAWGRVELLDFPAQAWWGPSAAAGAVQWRAPSFSDAPHTDLTAGGGTGGFVSVEGDYSQTDLGVSAAYRRAPHAAPADGPSNAGGFEASAQVPGMGDWALKGSALVLGGGGDDWLVGLGDLRWTDGDFQRVRLRPYVQTAHSGGEEAREAGADLDYDLDLAGIAEGNLMAGMSRREGWGARTAGFLQNTELLDALGDFTLDGAFRLDWTGNGTAFFSDVVGAQMALGDLMLRADEAGAQDPADPGRPVEQAELGFRLRGGGGGWFDAAYRHLSNSQTVLNGLESGAEGALDFLEGPVLRKAAVEVRFQYLIDGNGTGRADAGAGWQGLWFGGLGTGLWVRQTGGGPLYGSARLSCRLDPHCEVFLEGQNLGDLPVSWPEPDGEPGLNLMGGVHLRF